MDVTPDDVESLCLTHNTAILEIAGADFPARACNFMQVSTCSSFVNVVRFATEQLGAKWAVVERQYVDADYLCDYLSFYAKAFSPPPAKCGRVHFFSCELLPQGHLLALGQYQSQYLGYMVVRPTGDRIVGRTCLKCRPLPSNQEYLLCSHTFRSHVNGDMLAVESFPFISQDTNTFVCAGAAMWMQAYYMHERFGFPRYYPAQITEKAMQYNVRGNVRQGLSLDQMCIALRDMGYNPHIYSYQIQGLPDALKESVVRRAALIAHAVVESRIPCILGIEFSEKVGVGPGSGHALTAIGHSFEIPDGARLKRFSVGPKDNAFAGVLFNGDWVSWFVIHDDQKTPYGRLWVWDKSRAGPGEYCLWDDVARLTLVVPMPREVSMELEHAVVCARRAFAWWNSWVESVTAQQDMFIRHWNGYRDISRNWLISDAEMDPDLAIRFYLEPSEDFKERLDQDPVHVDFKKAYKAMSLPKYVWVAEFGSSQRLNSPSESNRTIKGKVLIDPTANPFDSFPPILAFQYMGRFACKRTDSSAPIMLFVKDVCQEYAPLIRGTSRR